MLTHGDKSNKTVLEVKTVVDTDYDAQLHQVPVPLTADFN